MSEATQSQKQMVVLLVIIAALLAAIAGVIIYQQSNSSSTSGPVATTQPTQQPATTDPNAAPADSGAGASGVAPAGAEFDPATAPVVPADMTPEEFVTEYYELSSAGEYDEAYAMLPTATQAYYGDSSGFASTLEGYGITGFSVDPPVEEGDTVVIVGHQEAQGMDFSYSWTLVKGDDGAWLVQSREMAGM